MERHLPPRSLQFEERAGPDLRGEPAPAVGDPAGGRAITLPAERLRYRLMRCLLRSDPEAVPTRRKLCSPRRTYRIRISSRTSMAVPAATRARQVMES